MFGSAMCGLVQLLGVDVVSFAGPNSPVSVNEDVCKAAIDNKYTAVCYMPICDFSMYCILVDSPFNSHLRGWQGDRTFARIPKQFCLLL